MPKFTKMSPEDFKHMAWDAGIILDDFDPQTGEVDLLKIRWATTGDNSFSATRDLTDMGADINNCPENTMQLQKANPWQAALNGTAVTVTAGDIAMLLGNADVEEITSTLSKITPRSELLISDFHNKWLVFNYSEFNGEKNGGFCAIHILNTLSVDGFSGSLGKNRNGTFPFNLKAFYDMEDMDRVPFDIYIQEGTAESETTTPGTERRNLHENACKL